MVENQGSYERPNGWTVLWNFKCLDYGPADPGFDSLQRQDIRLSSITSKLSLGSSQPPTQLVQGTKWPRPSTEVRKERSYTAIHPTGLHDVHMANWYFKSAADFTSIESTKSTFQKETSGYREHRARFDLDISRRQAKRVQSEDTWPVRPVRKMFLPSP